MDFLIIFLGIGLLLAGLAGCLIPVLPGPPLSYLALLLLHLTGVARFETRFLLWWAAITAVVTLLDFLIPLWGAKKFGASKAGVWGTLLGLLAGLFMFPPVGIVIGPFVGAVLGELIAGKKANHAMTAGYGAFLGFIGGMALKFITSGMMSWYFFKALLTVI